MLEMLATPVVKFTSFATCAVYADAPGTQLHESVGVALILVAAFAGEERSTAGGGAGCGTMIVEIANGGPLDPTYVIVRLTSLLLKVDCSLP